MNNILVAFLVSLIVFTVVVGIYRMSSGIWPGGRLLVQDPPASTSNDVDQNNVKFMMFYTDWCGYSKQAQGPWKSFKQFLENSPKTYGGKTVIFEEINGDSQKGRTALYNVDAYPTFKVQTQDKVYQMLGKPSVSAFRAFLIAAVGKESS